MAKEFKSFFKHVEGNEGDRCHYPDRLDTYGCGCRNNCGFCYAKSLLDFRKLWNPLDPSVADIKKIKRLINTKLEPGSVIRLGGMTDCFQDCEREHNVTYETIKLLNERGVHYLIVTKNADLVSSDKYIEVMDKRLAHIQVSFTNTNEELRKRIEPGAPSYLVRKAGIEKLQEAGFDVTLRLSPYIPEFVDMDIVNSVKCDKILVEFLRTNTWIEKWLTNLDAGVDLSRYSLRSHGYKHLPIEEKQKLLAEVKNFKQVSVCEDVPEHWEFWRDHVNQNPKDCCNLSL